MIRLCAKATRKTTRKFLRPHANFLKSPTPFSTLEDIFHPQQIEKKERERKIPQKSNARAE
jgi:hypothetical protein